MIIKYTDNNNRKKERKKICENVNNIHDEEERERTMHIHTQFSRIESLITKYTIRWILCV